MALSHRLASHAARLAVLAAAVYYAVWGGEYSAFDLRRLEQIHFEEDAALRGVHQEVDSLRILAARLEKDPATLERVARERFGMIREGELLFRFLRVDTTTAVAPRLATSP
jgi:cell division protein FtsB